MNSIVFVNNERFKAKLIKAPADRLKHRFIIYRRTAVRALSFLCSVLLRTNLFLT
jgi:hypothetical protein